MLWCHLLCDDFRQEGLEELHAFAQALGIPRLAFQNPAGKPRPHYDLSPGYRELAVARGALQLSRREVVDWLQRGRQRMI